MEQPQQQIDVDQLAKDKVQEIERLLNSSDNQKLAIVDQWFTILKQIITAADLHRTNDKNDNHELGKETKVETDDSIYADYADDNEQFNAVDLTEQFATNSVKWTIRVKAFKLVHRLVLILIQSNKTTSNKMPLTKYLSDLVRLAFVAATSPYDDLKTQGFEMFKFLIERFAFVEEREFPGVSILYQYRNQVLSALKPAFNLDAPPYITAIASQVCCLWICKGFEKDPNNLKRTYQLMLASIDKLENQSVNQNSKLYTECELEQERLDLLGSWAKLYITGNESDDLLPTSLRNSKTSGFEPKHLNELVKNNIASLVDRWWEALKDYALLIMPASRIVSISHEHENVYTREVALKLFGPVWPNILLASVIWLSSDDSKKHFSSSDVVSDDGSEDTNCKESPKIKYAKFIYGLIMKELCLCNSNEQKDFLPESTLLIMKSLSSLVKYHEVMPALVGELAVAQEFYTILYSILINRTKPNDQYHLFIRNLLDDIFILVVKKVVTKPDLIGYSLNNLCKELKADIENISGNLNPEKSHVIDVVKINLIIRLTNVVNVIKLAPEEDCLDHYDSLLTLFRSTLVLETDISLGVTLLELLKDFYAKTSQAILHKFIDTLFVAKKDNVVRLLGVFRAKEGLSREKVVQCLTHLDYYLRSMRNYIGLSNDNDSLVKIYVEVLLDKLIPDKSDINPSRNKDMLDLCIKNIKDLDVIAHDQFERVVTSDLRTTFESALSMQQAIKSEVNSKRQQSVVKKSTCVPATKPAAKITLKADFSNFYAKKS